MTFETAVQAAAGVLATGIGGWMIRSLVEVSRLISVVQSEIKAHADKHAEHDERHASHDERGFDHEKRISRIEGCRDALPRPG